MNQPFNRHMVCGVMVACTALLLSDVNAQVAPTSAQRSTDQQIELAAAGYMRQVLAVEVRGRRGERSDSGALALDRRIFDPIGRDEVEGEVRDSLQAQRLADSLGAYLVDGRHAVVCATDTPTTCRMRIAPDGLLRMSAPRVHRGTARVVVDFTEAGPWARMPVQGRSWDLLLVHRRNGWTVIPERSSRRIT